LLLLPFLAGLLACNSLCLACATCEGRMRMPLPLQGRVYIAPGVGAWPGAASSVAAPCMHTSRGSPARQRVAHAGVTARAGREHVGPRCPPRRTGDGTRGRRARQAPSGLTRRARGWCLCLSRPPH